jgi:hypothetical protein
VKTRRVTALVLVFLAAAALPLVARPIRIGLEFGNPTGVIIVRPEPLDFKLGYDFTGVGQSGNGNDAFVHFSGDYRILSSYHLVDFLSLFLAAGGYIQIYTGDAEDAFNLGARLPVGLQTFLLDKTLEIFLEVTPTVSFLPSITAFDQFQEFINFTIPLPGQR